MEKEAKKKLEGVRIYGRRLSELLLSDQIKFIETAMVEFAKEQIEKIEHPSYNKKPLKFPSCGADSVGAMCLSCNEQDKCFLYNREQKLSKVSPGKVCPDCGDYGWIDDEQTGMRRICPCHY